MTEVALGWVIYRLASALVKAGYAMQRWAWRRYQRPRAIRVYEAPTVSTAVGGRDRPRIGGAAGPMTTPEADTAVLSPIQTPAADPRMAAAPPPPALPDGTRPLQAVAGGSPKRGRHASGRVLWFPDWLRWLWPRLEVTA